MLVVRVLVDVVIAVPMTEKIERCVVLHTTLPSCRSSASPLLTNVMPASDQALVLSSHATHNNCKSLETVVLKVTGTVICTCSERPLKVNACMLCRLTVISIGCATKPDICAKGLINAVLEWSTTTKDKFSMALAFALAITAEGKCTDMLRTSRISSHKPFAKADDETTETATAAWPPSKVAACTALPTLECSNSAKAVSTASDTAYV